MRVMADMHLATDVRTDTPVSRLRIVRDRTLYERRVKRPQDVVLGTGLLLLGAPVILLIAAVVRVNLGRGVFYRQERVGLGGESFTILKFRTMQHDRRREQQSLSIDDRRQSHKVEDDPRHTTVGRFLRRFSLDELPQLINVVRGDMSLVGPRPEIPEVADRRGYLDHVRHDVRPGMTGPYQTSNLRLTGDLRDGLAVDAEYVRTITFRGDATYLLKTVTTMLGGSSQGT